MPRRADEIQTRINTQVRLLSTLRLLLLAHVRLMLIIHKINNRNPRVTVIDIIPKARGVNHSELDFELFLLKLGLDDLHLRKFVELLQVTPRVVLGRGELGCEERVDERRLTQTGLADDHHGEVRTALCDDFVPLCRNALARAGEKKKM